MIILKEFERFQDDGFIVDLVPIAEKLCTSIMAHVLGLRDDDYQRLIEISRPITELLYGYKISKHSTIHAFDAIEEYEKFTNTLVNQGKIDDHGFINQMMSNPDVSLSLLINVLVDGQDTFESFVKSVMFLWSNNNITNVREDMRNIFGIIAPFTYISRVSVGDNMISGNEIKNGDRVICIIPEQGNEESTSHGSLAFGKGIHRCLGEPLVVKFIKQFYPVLLSYADAPTCTSFDTNNEFGYFTFTKLMTEYRGR